MPISFIIGDSQQGAPERHESPGNFHATTFTQQLSRNNFHATTFTQQLSRMEYKRNN
jgi:hypothetical protein